MGCKYNTLDSIKSQLDEIFRNKSAEDLPQALKSLWSDIDKTYDIDFRNIIELERQTDLLFGGDLFKCVGDLNTLLLEESSSEIPTLVPNPDPEEIEDLESNAKNLMEQSISRYFKLGKEVADSARLYFKRTTKVKFVNTFFADRINGNGTLVFTDADLNSRIRDLKLELINTINLYLGDNGLQFQLFDFWTNTVNTKDYNEFIHKVSAFFPINIQALNDNYKDFKLNNSNREEAKQYLDAYNAFILLTNFDTVLKSIVGDVITANPTFWNLHIYSNSLYTFKSSAKYGDASVFDLEILNISSVVSTLPKLLIETTRRYYYQGQTPIEDSYITFNDFNRIIGKLKQVALLTVNSNQFAPESVKIVEKDILVYDTLTETSKEVLEELKRKGIKLPTLLDIINGLNTSPLKYLHAIFDILTSNNVIINNNNLGFDSYDKDIIWSLNKEIFGLAKNSLAGMHSRIKKDSIYAAIALLAGSVYSEDYLQHYFNFEGNLSSRRLSEFAVEGEVRKLISDFKSKASRTLSNSLLEYITPIYKVSTLQLNKLNVEYLESIETNIEDPVTEVHLLIKTNNDISILSWTKGGKPYKPSEEEMESFWKCTDFQKLIKTVVSKDFSADVELQNAYLIANNAMYSLLNPDGSITNTVVYNKVINDISQLMGRIIFNSVINAETIPQIIQLANAGNPSESNKMSLDLISSLRDALAIQFPDVKLRPRLDVGTGLIDPINFKNYPIINTLGKAVCIARGVLGKASYKTGEDTQIAALSLSRLRNAYGAQLQTFNRREDSATRDMTFVHNKNGLFKGVLTNRELKNNDGAVPIHKLSVGEYFQLNFMDFISGYTLSNNSYDYFKDGIVGFTPTVNSDKTLLDLLIVDLKAIALNGKQYVELTNDELLDQIRLEIGTAYNRALEGINTDIQKVLKDLKIEIADSVTTINFTKNALQSISEFFIKLAINNNSKAYLKYLENKSLTEDLKEQEELKNKFLKKAVSEGLFKLLQNYNNTHTDNIALAEDIHYNYTKDGYLTINSELPLNIERFARYEQTKLFFAQKELELARDLLRSNFLIDLEGPFVHRDQKELQFLRGEYNSGVANSIYDQISKENASWMDENGRFIIAKELFVDGTEKPLRTEAELDNAIKDGQTGIIVHPMLVRMNRLDFLTTQLYTLATVGSHIFHKTKTKEESLVARASDRWLASTKRNNALTATVHKFATGLIDGIPSKYNIAIIDDIEAPVYNMMGLMSSHTPLDGGMFVNGFINYLENNSLVSEKAGVDKKLFGTFYNPTVMSGGLIKTAGFAVTNDRMRTSPVWENLQRKMSSPVWKDLNGREVDVDITINGLTGEEIDWSSKGIYYQRPKNASDPNSVYNLYKLTDLIYAGDGNYEIHEVEVNTDGSELSGEILRTVHINNNWTLFNEVFGGKFSLELRGDKLVYSENSMKFMVDAINQSGIWRDTDTVGMSELLDRYVSNDSYIPSLEDFYQPLKYSDIHYCPNKGAIKSLIYNVNPSDALYNDELLNFFTMEVLQLGIQLDKEHHVDEAEVSMPSQIISACGNKGYTVTDATALYKSLGAIAKIATDKYFEGLSKLVADSGQFEKDDSMHTLQVEMAKTLAEELMVNAEDNEDLADLLAELIVKMENGEEITPDLIVGKLPWSDGMVFGKVYAKAASNLTKNGIKLKFAGSLAVINPTTGVIQLHGNTKRDSLMKIAPNQVSPETLLHRMLERIARGYEPKQMIFDINWEFDANKSTEQKLNALASKIETQHNYTVQFADGTTKSYTINTPKDYYELQNLIRHGQTKRLSEIGASLKLKGTGTKNVAPLAKLITPDLQIDENVFNEFIETTSEYFDNLYPGSFKYNKVINLTNRKEHHFEGEPFTIDHLRNVVNSAIRLNTTSGLNLQENYLLALALAALFHDIGKPLKLNDHGLDSLTILNELFDDSLTPDIKLAVRFHMLNAKSPQFLYDLMVKEVALAKVNHEKFITLIKALKASDILSNRNLEDLDPLEEGKLLKESIEASMNAFDSNYRAAMNRVSESLKAPNTDLDPTYTVDVVKIYEDIETPRDLAAYNVKFKTTNKEGRNSFNIFDLDSVRFLYKLEDKNFDYKEYEKEENAYLHQFKDEPELQNWRQLKATALFIKENPKAIIPQEDESLDVKKHFLLFKYLLQVRLRNEMLKDMFKLSEEFPEKLTQSTVNGNITVDGRRVSIGNNLYTVDVESLEIIPFELIMPKAYAKLFGLDPHDDLQEILLDEMWFAKRNLKKLSSKLSTHPEYYSYELKRFNGDHVYVVSEEQFNNMVQTLGHVFTLNLSISGNFFKKSNPDGTIDRIDLSGEVLHGLSSASDVIYNAFGSNGIPGIEIIKTKNPEYYINNLDYNVLSVSDIITKPDPYAKSILDTIESLRTSSKVGIKNFFEIHSDSKTPNDYAKTELGLELLILLEREANENNTSIFNRKFDDLLKNHKNLEPYRHLFNTIKRNASEIHASFDESLNILAGRIPAQSQQSFMTQRVVAFDNPDINSAYVGVFQLWLQGSDLDIDAVTLLGSEFSRDGKYVMWSPYANLLSKEHLKASKKLPFPSGESIVALNIGKLLSFVSRFANYFKNGTLELKLDRKTLTFKLAFNTRTAKSIENIGKLLLDIEKFGVSYSSQTSTMDEKIDDISITQFLRNWRDSLKTFTELLPIGDNKSTSEVAEDTLPIGYNYVKSLADELVTLVNTHNQYLQKAKQLQRQQMTKNHAVRRMWNVIASPSNVTQAMVSVDTATAELKSEAAKSTKAKDGFRTEPGNLCSKYNQIQEGSVGKDCVSNTAVGTKANSMILFYLSYVLNHETDPLKRKRILLPNGGVTIGGTIYKSFANLFDKTTWLNVNGLSLRAGNLDAETEAQIVNALINNWDLDYDAAVTIAAFLSISVDNAKDLALAKLNAGPEMVGMYVFGAALGVPASTLIQIINGKDGLGQLLSNLTKGNSLAHQPNISRVLQAIDYLDNGYSYKYVTQYDSPVYFINKDQEGNKVSTRFEYKNSLQKRLSTQSDILAEDVINFYTKLNKEGRLNSRQYDEFKKASRNLASLLNILLLNFMDEFIDYVNSENSVTYKMLNSSKNSLTNPENRDAGATWHYGMKLLLDYIKQYNDLQKQWNAPQNENVRKDLITLAQGGEELRILGAILSANKGVKGKVDDALNWISNIEDALLNSKKGLELGKDLQKINLVRFVTDYEYQQKMIDLYDKCKVAINLLDIIATVPHIREYVKTCAIPYGFLVDSSKRFRTLQKYCNNETYQSLGAYSTRAKQVVYQGVNNAFSLESLINWLASKNATFRVPKDFVKFLSRGILKTVTSENGELIYLGSEVGLANFKKYMEEIVFEDIKNHKYTSASDNTFVRDLTKFSLSITPGHLIAEAYTLVGTLLPNTEEENLIYEKYVSDFFDLGNLYVLNLDEGKALTLEEAIYIYALYVNAGKTGPRSFLGLFKTHPSATKDSYREYLAKEDALGDFDWSKEKILKYCSPIGSMYSGMTSGIYASDNEHIGYTYMDLFTLRGKELSEYIENTGAMPPPYVPGSTTVDLNPKLKESEEASTLLDRFKYFLYPDVVHASGEVYSSGDNTQVIPRTYELQYSIIPESTKTEKIAKVVFEVASGNLKDITILSKNKTTGTLSKVKDLTDTVNKAIEGVGKHTFEQIARRPVFVGNLILLTKDPYALINFIKEQLKNCD